MLPENLKDTAILLSMIIAATITASLMSSAFVVAEKGECDLNRPLSYYNPTYRLGCFLLTPFEEK